MNEIIYYYIVKLYIKHNIEMVHIIVDKHMNKINFNYLLYQNDKIFKKHLKFRLNKSHKKLREGWEKAYPASSPLSCRAIGLLPDYSLDKIQGYASI